MEPRSTLILVASTGLLWATMVPLAAAEVTEDPPDSVPAIVAPEPLRGASGVIAGGSQCLDDVLHLAYATELPDAIVSVDGVPVPADAGTIDWPTLDGTPAPQVTLTVSADAASYELDVQLRESTLEACTSLGASQLAISRDRDRDDEVEVKGVVISADEDADADDSISTGPGSTGPGSTGSVGVGVAGPDRPDEGDFASAVAQGARSVTGSSAPLLAILAAVALILFLGIGLMTASRSDQTGGT